ncbi:DUF3168 domain-containing protein [Stappia sp. GBMRC 2046]|uniref:DUF3168 domain-containing protein n=1 Tax=Stappia sediminis TaxID=2692190 RepID=A0A7X3LV51_9HYPH|nr:DUF3168 domain-containing protein [Stappia sediminis]MXN65706.1 DUF3168 domain-containing protein [Stappia sediminis]
MSAASALRAGIVTELRGDAVLTALLGGANVFDGSPRGAAHPFVTLGTLESEPLDGDIDGPTEHRLELFVFSRAASRSETFDVLEAIRMSLNGSAIALGGYRLSNLEIRDSRSERLSDGRTWRGRLRLRAVTEPE